MEFVYQTETIFSLEKTPKRIVSLVPSQTELLADLGLEDEIMGITTSCVQPYYLSQQKKIVGGTKELHIEVIRGLKPDIILCNNEVNTKEIITLCKEIAPVHVSKIYTIDDALKLTEQYGELFNKRTDASKIIQKINFKLADFKEFIKQHPPQKVAYFIWRQPWMAAGKNTFINHLLELNNFTNIYNNREGFPVVPIKRIRLEGDPDIVFLSSEPYSFEEEHAFELGRSTHHAKTVFVDGTLFTWHGTRLLRAFDYFKELHSKI